jgi:hypothetical protein
VKEEMNGHPGVAKLAFVDLTLRDRIALLDGLASQMQREQSV